MGRIHRISEQKGFNDQDNHNGVVTHQEVDTLEYEVEQASRNITTKKISGGDAIVAELFQILKDVAVKMLHSIH